MSFLKFIIFFFFAITILISCKKNSFIKSPLAIIGTSTDTLSFDTVFTSAGSITKSFKIFNLNNEKLQLSKVKLMGGTSSSFKINVDGTSANEVDNVDIEANDSLYVFVQVNINPDNNLLPFIIADSILINYNGNDKYVQLQAYGQNARFLSNLSLSGNVTFTNNLPYVILGGLLIDSTARLTIEPGSRIYLHANAPIIVDGTLVTNGTKEENVVFNGDRLDPDYKDLPASWPGIYFRSNSQDNFLRFTVIKNAYQGLVAEDISTTANPKLKISQCVIENIYDAGILAVNTTIEADNSLISNCGSNLFLIYGGNYSFTNCTVASYGNIFLDHKNPVLQLSNFVEQNNQTFTADLKAIFTNCIFWGDGGNVDDEIVINKNAGAISNVTFDYVLYKALKDPDATFTVPAIKQDPLFDSINTSKLYFDFHFNKTSSPAVDAGTGALFPKDLDDNPRANGPTDLGCYEKQ